MQKWINTLIRGVMLIYNDWHALFQDYLTRKLLALYTYKCEYVIQTL